MSQSSSESDRWEPFTIGELQQLLGATITGLQMQIFPSGRGNLLPRLTEELSAALDRAVASEDTSL